MELGLSQSPKSALWITDTQGARVTYIFLLESHLGSCLGVSSSLKHSLSDGGELLRLSKLKTEVHKSYRTQFAWHGGVAFSTWEAKASGSLGAPGQSSLQSTPGHPGLATWINCISEEEKKEGGRKVQDSQAPSPYSSTPTFKAAINCWREETLFRQLPEGCTENSRNAAVMSSHLF